MYLLYWGNKCIFGFTYIIYQHFYKELDRLNIKLDLSNSVMIHGGGWKKLINESVSSAKFRESLNRVSGIKSIHDYYGMVEQTGSIFMECEKGHLHAPIFSDIIIRNPSTLKNEQIGKSGLIQLLSPIPHSYPGISILSDDFGHLEGIDDCSCGRKGKYFRFDKRSESADLKGCGDTID